MSIINDDPVSGNFTHPEKRGVIISAFPSPDGSSEGFWRALEAAEITLRKIQRWNMLAVNPEERLHADLDDPAQE